MNQNEKEIPLNPVTGNPYFTVSADGFGTGWKAGETRVIPLPELVGKPLSELRPRGSQDEVR